MAGKHPNRVLDRPSEVFDSPVMFNPCFASCRLVHSELSQRKVRIAYLKDGGGIYTTTQYVE